MKGLCRLISQHVFSEQALADRHYDHPAIPDTRDCDICDKLGIIIVTVQCDIQSYQAVRIPATAPRS